MEDLLKENLKFKNNNYAEIMSVLSNFNHEEKHEFLSIKHGKIIVLHGDQYDAVTSNAKWISKFGGMLYDALIVINRPLSKYLKNLTKKISEITPDIPIISEDTSDNRNNLKLKNFLSYS